MRLPMPDWHIAELAVEGYAEDGVEGKVGYDDRSGEWYAEFNDDQYNEYMANLNREHNKILQEFCKPWDGVNVQASALEPPKDNENRLAIYLLDIGCRMGRGFKVLFSLGSVFNRKSAFMTVGSTCEHCGQKMLVVITWEDVKPKGGNSEIQSSDQEI